MASLIPTNLLNSYKQASANGARDLVSNAMQMAGNYLQGLKTMSGGQPGVPLKTMARQESDMGLASTQQSMDIAKRTLALNELQKYADLSGKAPSMDIMKMLGVDDTFSPIAGDTTAEMNLDKIKLAINAAKGGGSSGGGSSGLDGGVEGPLGNTAAERKAYATSQAQKAALATYNRNLKEGSEKVKKHPLYYSVYSILADPAYTSDFAASGVDTKKVIEDLIVTKGKTSTAEFFKSNPKLGELYYSKFPIKL